jgi:hypothetical protein
VSARKQLVLNAVLLGTLVATYRPDWMGVAVHQWLGMAIIVPLLAHNIVNWNRRGDQASRRSPTCKQEMPRVSAAANGMLFVITVCAMVSGFMVSPALRASLGVHSAETLVWHDIHAWSANATVVLLALHVFMRAHRLFEVVSESSGGSTEWRPRRAGAVDTAVARTRERLSQSADTASERAMAFRTLAVVGTTALTGLGVFVGVSLMSPPQSAFGQAGADAVRRASAVCPSAGCTASRCHANSRGRSVKVGRAATDKAPARAVRSVAAAPRRDAAGSGEDR